MEIKGRQSKNNRPIFPSNFAKNELSRRTPQYFGVISFSHSLPVESFLRIEQVDFRNTKTKNDTIKIFKIWLMEDIYGTVCYRKKVVVFTVRAKNCAAFSNKYRKWRKSCFLVDF